MSDTPFIKFYPSDFLGGTSGLTPAERGVYITILCLVWDGDGPVSMNEGRLARRCGMPKAAFKRALESLIDEGKIVRTPEGLTNKRAKKTLIDRQSRTQNATHAANQRWHAQSENIQQNQDMDNADALPEQCPGDAKPEARSQSIGGGGGGAGQKPPEFLDRERILEAIGVDTVSGMTTNGGMIGTLADMQIARRWRDDLGLSIDEAVAVVREVMASKRDGPPSTFKYFNGAMQRAAGLKDLPKLEPTKEIADDRPRNGGAQRARTGAGGSRAHASLYSGFVGGISDNG